MRVGLTIPPFLYSHRLLEMMKYHGVMELKQSQTLERLVSEGRLGRKTGCGFFDYTKGKKSGIKKN